MASRILLLHAFTSFFITHIHGQSVINWTDSSTINAPDITEKLSLESALELRFLKRQKQQEFSQTKREALKHIPKELRPGKLLRQGNFTTLIMEYDGVPMPVYILMIAMIPLVLAELCRLLWNLVRPKLKFQQEGGGEFPFTACYHLQESLREQILKRPARNCTSWFVHQYILAIEDETLEWKDVIESLQPASMPRKRNPWKTIRMIFRLKNMFVKSGKQGFVQDRELEHRPIMAGNHIQCHLRAPSSQDTLHLEAQISQLEMHYKTLNALEKDYEVPSPPHPELFTVSELMEFMTRDEKLLVLRCFNKSQMNELMININIEEIRKKNADYVNAHMEATASVYKHVDELATVKISSRKRPWNTPSNANEVEEDENQKSIETLYRQKDRLAQDIVEANENLLKTWEASDEHKQAKENIQPVLQPVHVKKEIRDDTIEHEELSDESIDLPYDDKTKPVTSDEKIKMLIKKAEKNIDNVKKRKEAKKIPKKKKVNSKGENKQNPQRDDKKAEEKAPLKWLKKSEEEEKNLDYLLKDVPEMVHTLKDRNDHANLHDFGKNENQEGKTSMDEGESGKRKSTGNNPREKKRRKSSEKKGKEKERKTSENERKDEQRKLSDGKTEEKEKLRKVSEPKENEKRRISDNPPGDENKKIPENEVDEKEKRKYSGKEHSEKEKRRLSEKQRKEEEKRRIDENERIEKEKLMEKEATEQEMQMTSESQPDEERKISLNDNENEEKPGVDVGIQTHHHHHRSRHLSNPPNVHPDTHEKKEHRNSHRKSTLKDEPQENNPNAVHAEVKETGERKRKKSDNENEATKEGKDIIHGKAENDIHVVHDDTVAEFLKKIDNAEMTKSEVKAVERDVVFQASLDHPEVKIYSQGRRNKFENAKRNMSIKKERPAEFEADLDSDKIDETPLAQQHLTEEGKVQRRKTT